MKVLVIFSDASMNIKNVQKYYSKLTKEERFSLFMSAFLRKDEFELQAVIAVSPRYSINAIDFHNELICFWDLQMGVLAERLNYAWCIEKFLFLSETKDGISSEEAEKSFRGARMTAYLYVSTTDGWLMACDKLGIDRKLLEKRCEKFFAYQNLQTHDELIRDLAMTESEVRGYCSAKTREHQTDIVTAEKLAEEYLSVLLEYRK